jgi:hypothetical protein
MRTISAFCRLSKMLLGSSASGDEEGVAPGVSLFVVGPLAAAVFMLAIPEI